MREHASPPLIERRPERRCGWHAPPMHRAQRARPAAMRGASSKRLHEAGQLVNAGERALTAALRMDLIRHGGAQARTSERGQTNEFACITAIGAGRGSGGGQRGAAERLHTSCSSSSSSCLPQRPPAPRAMNES
eukprot:TRINITY_DN1837_c0_g1_i2.p4 TRINITY_DN1837_c0_g1~~TRINITY_DN1837_c0_g1_i2.p4  ORF type:complete len:134 (+),score=24.74 TRINITY_DN1837_c0_g1_i2:739-1140(+)